jgi:N-carbamoyl-L-amino-acid hydrolase
VPLDPARTVAELKELRELTGDENGAQRVAWTETWETARGWLREKLAGLPLEEEIDEAGNQWWTLRGGSEREVLIGGHIDSVPNEGWLDGALNVVAGVGYGVSRGGHEPAVTVRLVAGPTEGALRPLAVRHRAAPVRWPTGTSCGSGTTLTEGPARCWPRAASSRALEAHRSSGAPLLELHIEQGRARVMASTRSCSGRSVSAAPGERSQSGRACSDSTPMDKRGTRWRALRSSSRDQGRSRSARVRAPFAPWAGS